MKYPKTIVSILVLVFGLPLSAEENSTTSEKKDSQEFSPIQSGLGYRFFSPSTRVYFDTGTDDPGEIDIFKDGSVSVDLSVLELVYRFQPSGAAQFKDESRLFLGLAGGVGLSSRASDSEDGTEVASNAPIVLVTYGCFAEVQINKEKDRSIRLEFGGATGFSSSEAVDNIDDTALYFGLGFDF